MGVEFLDHRHEALGIAMSLMRQMALRARRLAGRALGRPSPPTDPLAPFTHYREKSAACGLSGLQLFLSFDCDTDWDFEVVEALDSFLDERSIAVTYAVPGAQLERGREFYSAVAARGREFMNHGARPHAEWRQDQYVPITFYQEFSSEEVSADILRGHQIVQEVTGQTAVGFRAPHFGSFQGPDDLALIYRTIEELGYVYASTTIPEKGLHHGPAYLNGGIVELPTFGSARAPLTILDTWTHLTDRRRYALSETYYELFAETIDVLTRNEIPALLTWYGDPSHAWQQTPFMKAMDLIASRSIPTVFGRQAAALYGTVHSSSSL
jgi:peptidoglycan/xylan/chitin deacetylase (PgdA/CDA1 family)